MNMSIDELILRRLTEMTWRLMLIQWLLARQEAILMSMLSDEERSHVKVVLKRIDEKYGVGEYV